MRYHKSLFGICLLLGCIASLPATAQRPQQPVIEPVLIAPSELQTIEFAASFFTDDTLLVADIDVSAVDAAAALGWLLPRLERGAMAQPQEAMLQQMAIGMIQTLRNAGVQHIYITVAARDLIQGGVSVLIPCDQTATVANLLEMMVPQLPHAAQYQVKSQPGYVVLSPKNTWERIKSRPAADRRGLLQAIRSVDHLPHRLAMQLPEALRQEVAAIWPDALPSSVPVQLSPNQLATDITAVAAGFRLPPNPQIETRLIAEDEAAAQRVVEQLQRVFALIPAALGPPAQSVQDDTVVIQFSGQWFEQAIGQLMAPMTAASAERVATQHLKQIGLAMHNYHDTYKKLPPRATIDDGGQPLLSWRVHILPFIDQKPLYEQFRLDEPWDSAHNRSLVEQMPETFGIPGDDLPAGQTRIRLPVIAGSLWEGNDPPRTFSNIVDGTSNTIAAAVAPRDAAVIWTKPEPWQLDGDNLSKSFFADAETVVTLLFDGSVRRLPAKLDVETLRALLTYAGGEAIDRDKF